MLQFFLQNTDGIDETFTGSGSPSFAAATCIGGSHGGSGSVALFAAVVADGTGTSARANYLGTSDEGGALFAAMVVATSDGHFNTVGVYSGTGAATFAAATAAGIGTRTTPAYTGTGTVTTAVATAVGAGTAFGPTGYGLTVFAAAMAAGTGTCTIGVFTGSGSPATRPLVAAGAGLFYGPTGEGSAVVTAATATGTGTFTTVVYTGSGSPSMSPATCTGHTGTILTGTGAVTFAAATATGTGTSTGGLADSEFEPADREVGGYYNSRAQQRRRR